VKLSTAQQEILDLMANGWELAEYTDYDGGWRIQKGGIGKGGESRTVNCKTAFALWNKDLIKPVSNEFEFPSRSLV